LEENNTAKISAFNFRIIFHQSWPTSTVLVT
jgi:hypothetical protein